MKAAHPVRVMKLSAPSILALTKLPKKTFVRSRSTSSWSTFGALGPCAEHAVAVRASTGTCRCWPRQFD